MKLITYLIVLYLITISAGIADTSATTAPSNTDETTEVVLQSQALWTFLNPKRGALAPMAMTLWGDRGAPSGTGFLLKPSDGFESPPHIHNVAYRGVVIRGLLHNDDPEAAKMWMPPGSFWTQPAGEVHITAALGSDTLAYIEIEDGPFKVLPKEDAYDDGERPVNVDASNIMWLDSNDADWVRTDGVAIAYLWGRTEADSFNGTFLRLPSGFSGTIDPSGDSFRAVVITGELQLTKADGKVLELDPGSYLGSKNQTTHAIATPDHETILYIRTNGKYQVTP